MNPGHVDTAPASPADTEPYSPTELDDGDFVRIYPVNKRALDEFAVVAARFEDDENWQAHAREYIVYTRNNENYQGYYRLNMASTAATKDRGWMVGSGNLIDPTSVHLILTALPHAHSVAARHCRLCHEPKSDRLVLQARHEVIIDGKHRVLGPYQQAVRARHQSTQILDSETGLGFGDLQYRLEFTRFSRTPHYVNQLALAKTSRGQFPVVAPLATSPTPARHMLGDWRIYDASKGGASCVVSAGYHAVTGQEIVCKEMVRNSRNQEDILHEIRMLKKAHHHNVIQLVTVIGNMDRRFFSDGEADVIRLIMAPATTAPLHSFFHNSECDAASALRLLRDCCRGLHHLHSKGIMHRDVKPHNIGVFRRPWKAVLLDLGHAIEADTHDDHYKGTVRYLAPEVIAIKNASKDSKTAGRYDKKVDIWGLGMSFSELLDGLVDWKAVTRTAYDKRFRDKASRASLDDSNLRELVGQAVRWDASERPTAEELLASVTTRLLKRPHVDDSD